MDPGSKKTAEVIKIIRNSYIFFLKRTIEKVFLIREFKLVFLPRRFRTLVTPFWNAQRLPGEPERAADGA